MTAGGLKRRQGVLDAASQTYFTGFESNVRHSGGVRGGPLSGDFWYRIRLWKAVAEEITRNRCLYQPEDPWEVRERLLVHQPEDPWEVRERLFRCFRGVSVTAGGLKRRQGVLDAASQTFFTGSESNVRHSGGVRGGPLSSDFWSRIRLWKAVAEEITRNRCL